MEARTFACGSAGLDETRRPLLRPRRERRLCPRYRRDPGEGGGEGCGVRPKVIKRLQDGRSRKRGG